MAHARVSSCVLAIIASFTGGIDILKRVRVRRRQHKRPSSEKISDEELQLVRSLRQGPDEIGRQYRKSVQAAGDQIAVGDGIIIVTCRTWNAMLIGLTAIAQTSLAAILLRLNTGLVNIIDAFISNDGTGLYPDYRSLTNLSEKACIDTCRALRQLHRRSMHLQLPPVLATIPDPPREQPDTAEEKSTVRQPRKERRSAQSTASRAPTLARITIQDSSKPPQIALVKPATRRKKSDSSSNLSKTSSAVSSPSSPPSPYHHSKPQKASVSQTSHVASDRLASRSKQGPVIGTLSKGSLPPLPMKKPYEVRVPPPVPQISEEPPLPLTSPRVEPVHHRAPVPTYYSVASNGTKIGEIPLDKWADKFDFEAMALMNQEAELNGWPYVPVGEKPKKGRLGVFRVFRRKA